MKFPFFKQHDIMDCGPSCIYMVCKYYGRSFSVDKIRELTEIGKQGVNLLGISDTLEKIGFRTLAAQLSYAKLQKEAPLPAIVHWGQKHFVIVHRISKSGRKIYIADPAKGLMTYTKQEFFNNWLSDKLVGEATGIALLLQPSPAFYTKDYGKGFEETPKRRLVNIISYLKPFRRLIVQLFVAIILGSIFQLILPFLTQSIVDIGINTNNFNFIQVILIAQLALFVGRVAVDFIRSWILYHISSRINISILTDFLIKLMKLPVSFFDAKMTGDIMQRMNDHQRIQSFLTGTSLNTIFSLFSFIIFAVALEIFNTTIFIVFVASSFIYGGWIIIFLKRRRELDYKQFDIASTEQNKTIQLIQGMQEIKLQGSEKQKRWEWERLQASLFSVGIKSLSLNQWQQAGAFSINECKNILITFISARAVIRGEISLGAMLAIQYIIGQLNTPIEQMINFIQSWQLAKISLDRLNDIHALKDEEPSGAPLSNYLPSDKTIEISNLSYTYPGAGNTRALKNINLTIPEGQVTAIVGTSGSGKTTLLKLLLKFYKPQEGEIRIGGNNIENISHKFWRSQCGVVMQDSYIFSDTIANNIAVGEEKPSMELLKASVRSANIQEFIESLPLGYNTKIGAEGIGISAGQKQRILIARGVYKSPHFILLDEATNSLDANNESTILKNLTSFFKGKTVIVVAHRLSTVKNANNIIVLNKGEISEQGNHQALTKKRGEYFELVKNQLELGE